jgi:hypothetical protein
VPVARPSSVVPASKTPEVFSRIVVLPYRKAASVPQNTIAALEVARGLCKPSQDEHRKSHEPEPCCGIDLQIINSSDVLGGVDTAKCQFAVYGGNRVGGNKGHRDLVLLDFSLLKEVVRDRRRNNTVVRMYNSKRQDIGTNSTRYGVDANVEKLVEVLLTPRSRRKERNRRFPTLSRQQLRSAEKW